MMSSEKEIKNREERPWGYFINLHRGDNFLVKIIHVNPKGVLSVQSHNHRSEHWAIVSGVATVLLSDKEFVVNAGQSVDIPLKAIHSVKNMADDPLEFIEIQSGEYLSEEDIVRYKDIYGRV